MSKITRSERGRIHDDDRIAFTIDVDMTVETNHREHDDRALALLDVVETTVKEVVQDANYGNLDTEDGDV